MHNNYADKLPEELRKNYKSSRKNSPIIEALKVAAALKLWEDRGFEDIQFDVPMVFAGKRFFVKVLAKHSIGAVFGVECASTVRMYWLKQRLVTLQLCLPKDSYVVAVFPEAAWAKAEKVTALADEVWITGNNGKIKYIMFSKFFP